MTKDVAFVLGFAAAELAALLDGIATVAQAKAAQQTGSSVIRRGLLYAGGLFVDVLGWALAVFALRFLPVFAVQAIVAGQTAITVVLAHAVLRSAIRTADMLAIACTGVGLAVLAAGAGSTNGWTAPPQAVLAALLGILVVVAAAVVPAIRRGTIARSVVAGLAYGGSALAVRALLLQAGATADLGALLTHPLTYVVIGFAAVGVPMYAAALRHSTPAVPSAIVTMIEVVFPGTLAMLLLGDRVRPGWWWFSGAGLILATLGVTALVNRKTDSPGPHHDEPPEDQVPRARAGTHQPG